MKLARNMALRHYFWGLEVGFLAVRFGNDSLA
jgi:hypothetical protein